VKAVVAALVVLALVAPASAFAHATLLATSPENGAVLDAAPTKVTVHFDDTVRVAGGNAAVANATSESVLAGHAVAHGRTLVIPLEPHLRNGVYSVRWSIVSDDGHREQGVLAFAIGQGSGTPTTVLGAGVPLTWSDVLLRTLYYLGLLVAGGAAVFALLNRRTLGEGLQRPLAHLLFFSLLFAFLGASGIVHTAPPGTRYALVLKIAITLSLVGGAAAALAPSVPRLLPVSGACALALLLAPTLSGHALDRNQPRWLSVPADLGHIVGAAVWLGGLVSLVYLIPRASGSPDARGAAVRRFSSSALVAVLLVAASGLARALTELSAFSQVWSTSYGRALIVKTALFVPLIGLGWVNRTFLLRAFHRLRRSASIEVIAITGIVVAVAVLTELRPGTDVSRAAAAPAVVPRPAVLPPRNAVVDARELGDLAVAVAREPRRATVTIISSDGTGVDGRNVRIGETGATSCGSGCYRAPAPPSGPLRVSIGSDTLVFPVPVAAPGAAALLRQVTRSFRASRSIVFDERLASSPTNVQTTRFTVVAPNRLAYTTKDGAAAVVIGGRRWDRSKAGAAWVPSPQTPLDVTQPYWQSPTNAHLVAPDTITFLDRRIPAWFRVTVRNGRPTASHMTAAAHFMVDRYIGFDVPATVSPPSR
jgi:copper transport protein